MKSPLLIEVRTVKEKGRLQLSEDVPPEEFQECLAGQAALISPLAVRLDLAMEGGQMGFSGSVTGRWELECCRCLVRHGADYSAPVEGACPGTQGTLDAAEEVRQGLLLALPMRAFCRTDCKGLCPRCGAN